MMLRRLALLPLLLASRDACCDRLFLDGFDPPELARITAYSDEFTEAARLDDWQRLWQSEHWNADQLESYDVGATRPGWLTMLPYTSVWYSDYRGELAFQTIAGDFAATTHVQARNRAGSGAPGSTHGGAVGSEYSLAGVLLRSPRPEWLADTAALPSTWWTPGNERYVFLSFGSATLPGTYQFEVKTTVPGNPNSQSVLVISDAGAGVTEVDLRSVRIGPHIVMLRREPGQDWVVHRRYRRDDMLGPLQVGMTCYTDWAIASTWPYFEQNDSVITHAYGAPAQASDPDLLAQFDWFRFARPHVPAELADADLSNPDAVSDEELLAFLGAALD
jgi:hypothetical protein